RASDGASWRSALVRPEASLGLRSARPWGLFTHTRPRLACFTKVVSTARDSSVNPGEGARVGVKSAYHPRDSGRMAGGMGTSLLGCLAPSPISLEAGETAVIELAELTVRRASRGPAGRRGSRAAPPRPVNPCRVAAAADDQRVANRGLARPGQE